MKLFEPTPSAPPRHPWRRGLLGVMLVTTLAGVATASPPPVTARAASTTNCSWGAKSDPDTVNAAYPDTSATYWSYQYRAVPGTELIIHGTYPVARYFSFHVYQPNAVPIDSIYDSAIRPDAGSRNPFSGPVPRSATEHYTVTVLFTPKPVKPAANTVYAGQTQIGGAENPGGTLMLRVYVPRDPSSPQGGVPLPTVTWQTTAGTILGAGGACSSNLPSSNGAVAEELNSLSFPAQAPPTGPATISWGKAKSSPYAGAYGNQQNAYLTATISRDKGNLVVVHALAPSFPNTSKGQPVYGRDQVRYWSLCENSVDTRVISCAPDYQAPLRNGFYTYVISDPSQRPSNATAANGVTWLPWGSTDAASVIILRNMLPSATFTHAVQDVDASTNNAQQVMGPYFPSAVYCSTATFERGGWQACAATGS
jgi:hypothetical protein